jgi:hypothetical protein
MYKVKMWIDYDFSRTLIGPTQRGRASFETARILAGWSGRSKLKPIRAQNALDQGEPKCASMFVSRSQPLPPPF